MKRATILALTFIIFGAAAGEPAYAHKVIASVFAGGDTIEGEIGFSNGDMAVDALVEVFDDKGNKLGETMTDSDGFFTYTPTKRVIHVFKSNLGAGHVAEVRMELDDLPDIPGAALGGNPGGETIAAQTEEGAAPSEAPSANAAGAVATQISEAALEEHRELVREMIHREVSPLRREIAAYKEKNDFQTILGGIGYIVGLFGLFFYLAARRKLAQG